MRFFGTGSAAPSHVLTNDLLATMVETSDEWIRERTGIRERRILKDETLPDLALRAATAALDAAATQGIAREQIDLVICATVSHKEPCPSLACILQRELGLRENILAFDLNAACSGFVYALIVASRFVAEGKHALLVGCEALSRYVDFTDRSTCILFGDGAGAAVVGPSATSKPSELHWVAEARGNAELLSITDYIHMDGQAVFKFAVEVMVRSVRDVVGKAGLSLDEIDLFVCHQANERIIKSAAKRLGVPLERFFMNLACYGNTSAASIPLALDEALQSGALASGSKTVIAGFGGGLTAGAICLTWA
jgi:3-oxoacyl-[acyl-carrier-protein] synthase-3